MSSSRLLAVGQAQLATGPVTTNFDHVVETAFKQADNEFQNVVWGVKAISRQKP